MDLISFFYIGLILLVGCFLAGAVLSFRLKRIYPHICLEIGHPPATAWYPFWVLPLLRKRHFDLLNSAERLVVVFISLGLLLGIGLAVIGFSQVVGR